MCLVGAAQQGAADETRRAAEARMVELAGSIEAGPAGLHFVRAVAFYAVEDVQAASRGVFPARREARGLVPALLRPSRQAA